VPAGDLCDWEKLKRKLNLSSASSDDVVQSIVSQASEYLISKLSRTIVQATFTQKYSGRNTQRMTLREWPIVSVASVLIDGVAIPESTGTSVNGWYQSGDRELALRGFWFSKGFGNVVIAYGAGYAVVPLRFERACESICLRWYRELDRIGQVAKVVEGENVTFALGLPDDVKSLIESEREVVPV
jgi:hypothetical protein